jgi:hypothetical protein
VGTLLALELVAWLNKELAKRSFAACVGLSGGIRNDSNDEEARNVMKSRVACGLAQSMELVPSDLERLDFAT